MTTQTVRSPIGYCPICQQNLYGPNIIDHYTDKHPATLAWPRSFVDEEVNRRLREEWKQSGIDPTDS